MGEAKLRGTFEERKAAAIARNGGLPRTKPERRYQYRMPTITSALEFLWPRFRAGKNGETVGELQAQAQAAKMMAEEAAKARVLEAVKDA